MSRIAIAAALTVPGLLPPCCAAAQTIGNRASTGAAAVPGSTAAPPSTGAAGPANTTQSATARDLSVTGAGPESRFGTGAPNADVSNGPLSTTP